jgi:DNA repair exonuclease SbcCD ATPase subunit
MWIRKLTLENWGPYRGETVLELSPKPYAVIARRSGDVEQSNWVGKSMLLEAVFFALFGKFNPDRHMGADGWITDGEKRGSVTLEFDTGDTIVRSRKMGKSTQLQCGATKGDEAQSFINTTLGIANPEDFLATCYFQQRQMARLVLADPGTRMGYVSAWFQLEPLERGEEALREELAKLSWEASALQQNHERLQSIEVQELGGSSLQVISDQLEKVHGKLSEAQDKHARLQTLLEKNRVYADAPQLIVDYEELQRERDVAVAGLSKWGELDQARYAALVDEVNAARENLAICTRDALQKQKLVAGQFDGHCPVAAIECPATALINSRIAQNQILSSDAIERRVDAEKRLAKARFEVESVERIANQHRALQSRLQDLEVRLTRGRQAYDNAKSVPPAMDPDELRERCNAAHREVLDLTMQMNAYQRTITVVSAARREALEFSVQLDNLHKRMTTYREAGVIFGKQGAQRRVAESALQEIQRDANNMLAECGIQLEVDVSWSREGSGFAKTCDACGHPFPASAKVKTCEKCNAPRGANLVNKLDIVLSEQSGAAEDLAGTSVQLSAASWLRAHRGVRWSTALIDEPFGQLDRPNRRALSQYLSRVLTRLGGYEQALVISHTSDTDAFPGLIEIINDGTRTIARVAS